MVFTEYAARACLPGSWPMYERVYPFAWLGILAEARPHRKNSFMQIMSADLRCTACGRLRLRGCTCSVLQKRTGSVAGRAHLAGIAPRLSRMAHWRLNQGPILQKGVTGMRSFVVEPMQYGRLFLAGDAAHIVPPTGAKGLNLAVADVLVLSRALAEFYRSGHTDLLDRYSETCLRRVWKVQRFSWWMTSMFHKHEGNPFDDQAPARGTRLRVQFARSGANFSGKLRRLAFRLRYWKSWGRRRGCRGYIIPDSGHLGS